MWEEEVYYDHDGRGWEGGGGLGLSIGLMMFSIIGGVVVGMGWQSAARNSNMNIDRQIDGYLRTVSSSSGASFTLIRSWTQQCRSGHELRTPQPSGRAGSSGPSALRARERGRAVGGAQPPPASEGCVRGGRGGRGVQCSVGRTL